MLAFDDVFESSLDFEPSDEVTGIQEVVEMSSQLLMIVVIVTFDSSFLKNQVHALDLVRRCSVPFSRRP